MGKVETIKSALKFLVQKQIEQGSHGFSDNNDDEVPWKEVLEWIEQPTVEMAEDCISRQAVLEYQQYLHGKMSNEENHKLWEFITDLPSVQPQPESGKWIFVHPLQEDDEGAYMCSCCGVGNWGIDPKVDKYCFNCGAKMEDVQSGKEGVENV